MDRKRLIGWTIALSLSASALPGPVLAGLPQLEQPSWEHLSAEQRDILKPLAEDWSAMDAFRRKKWIGIAQRYPDMSVAEQASMQRNMREWALLTPEERKAAREKFKKLKKVTPEQQQSVKLKWEEYQALSQEERDLLRAKAPQRLPIPKTPGKPPARSTIVEPGRIVSGPAPQTAKSPLSPIKPPHSPLVPKTIGKSSGAPHE